MPRYRTVDEYFEGNECWPSEVRRLRGVLQSTPLEETLKWGGPCYTYRGKNVVGLGAFRSYFGLWFFQGAALDDPEGVLVNAQPGKTKHLRQWRMTSNADIRPAVIRHYIDEAIRLAAGG